MSAVEVRSLCRTFGSDSAPVRAVDQVDFTIDQGECVALVGESGSGKTTLARILVGLETPDSGSILVNGVDRGVRCRSRSDRMARARAAQMVFQNPYGSLDRRRTIQDIVATTVRMHHRDLSRSGVDQRTRELLESVGLDRSYLEHRPRQLSGGQRQRVAIARAIAVQPDLLVMDEAVSALDVSVQAKILDLVDDLRDRWGLTVLFVTHDLGVAAALSDRTLVMLRGRIVESGPTRQVLESPAHAYTQMLVSSMPGPGWDPAVVVERRRRFLETHAQQQGRPDGGSPE